LPGKSAWGALKRGREAHGIDTPKVSRGFGVEGVGIPLPSRLGGLGERRELPRRFLVFSKCVRTPLVAMFDVHGRQLNIPHGCHCFQTNYSAKISQLYRSISGIGELAID